MIKHECTNFNKNLAIPKRGLELVNSSLLHIGSSVPSAYQRATALTWQAYHADDAKKYAAWSSVWHWTSSTIFFLCMSVMSKHKLVMPTINQQKYCKHYKRVEMLQSPSKQIVFKKSAVPKYMCKELMKNITFIRIWTYNSWTTFKECHDINWTPTSNNNKWGV